MEKNFVLEDDGKYGAATMGWNAFQKALAPRVPSDPKMEKLYFEGYFYATRTLFKYAMTDPAVKNKAKVIDAAGKRISDLEGAKSKRGWELVGEHFRKLLETEPVLNEAYERMKKVGQPAGK
jgi:hypothetical protein